ncbi:MAG: helix-hairpin-helix domain-containing protein [Pseudomonadota bacterium]
MRIVAICIALTAFASTADAQVGRPDGLLSPNLTSEDALASLPGLDAAKAETIVAGRPYVDATSFAAVVETLDVDAEALYTRLFRPLNLNTASRDEIMLVPGMSRKMAHEFEEYRPYRSIEQFRREMSKYVDDAEVARLERYVFVPIDLNTASEAVIETIPGMSAKMVHEFEEYRPYTSLEQFRREMAKYVDADEVARLESYVEIRE